MVLKLDCLNVYARPTVPSGGIDTGQGCGRRRAQSAKNGHPGLPRAAEPGAGKRMGGRMAQIVVLGAGLGGIIMAYEMKDQDAEGRRADRRQSRIDLLLRAVQPAGSPSAGESRRKSPSALDPVLRRKGIALRPEGAKRVHPKENRIELNDGSFARLRLSDHRHRPRPRLRRDPGPRPEATRSRSATSTTPSRRRRRSTHW